MASQQGSLFDTFPDELLVMVVDYADSKDLPALARVNRSCYRVVLARLYTCANYIGDRSYRYRGLDVAQDTIPKENLAITGHGTEILHLEKLHRTLNENPELKSLIVVAAVYLDNSCSVPVCNVLQSLPAKLNRLHIAMADPIIDKGWQFDQITSISLNFQGWWPFPDPTMDLYFNISRKSSSFLV